MPGAVACAFLPRVPFTHKLAVMAHSNNKEVMLHAPMQAKGNNRLGPGGLTVDMSQEQFLKTLREDIEAVPHVMGISNHMGSLLTRHPGHMSWLMEEIVSKESLFFVDSLTTSETVARRVALEHDVPSISRDVFLDHDRDPEKIAAQLGKLISKAKQRGGWALGIGHPYPETMAILETVLPTLEYSGIKLIPVSQLITTRNTLRDTLWHASLSPSQKAVKNSKQ